MDNLILTGCFWKDYAVAAAVAVTPNLQEDRFFGHEKGAFTGAHEQKKGLFEIANGRWLKEHHRKLEAEQIAVLKSYDYPGSVRELLNILERAIVLDESDFAKLLKEHKEMTAGLKPSSETKEEIPDELEAAVRLHVKRVYENTTKT